MTFKELEKVLENEELKNQINNAETIEDMVEALAGHGIKMTAEQVEAALQEGLKQGGDELAEDDLEMVAGGKGGWWYKINPFYWVGKWIVETFLKTNGY